ncbi:hypothetical protein MKX08_007967 [Trichoderma sp. CBMAI-0020]|nr:hypothetical protein MKX08_007967 [Trichoderma sp. CBMAI-0020]
MYLKAIKALRSNLKDHSELLIKHKKLKKSSGTSSKKAHAINTPQLLFNYLLNLKPKANQGKKQDNYITKDNSTQLGRIDINTINHRRFNRTYNAYAKRKIQTKIRTTSTIKSISYNTNIKPKFLNFKTSTTITPTKNINITTKANNYNYEGYYICGSYSPKYNYIYILEE